MKKGMKVLSFTSGKGGVGKTNLVTNLGIELAERGHSVLLMDTDMGLANVHLLLGMNPSYNIMNVVNGEKNLEDIIMQAHKGLDILPASSEVRNLNIVSQQQRYGLLTQVENLKSYDYFLIDTGAGVGEDVLYFNAAAGDIFVVVTPEPTSFTNSYALIKVLNIKHRRTRFKIVVNMAGNSKTAKNVFNNLNNVAGNFLNIALDYAGYFPYDLLVGRSVASRKPYCLEHPRSNMAACNRSLADKVKKEGFLDGGSDDAVILWRKLTGAE